MNLFYERCSEPIESASMVMLDWRRWDGFQTERTRKLRRGGGGGGEYVFLWGGISVDVGEWMCLMRQQGSAVGCNVQFVSYGSNVRACPLQRPQRCGTSPLPRKIASLIPMHALIHAWGCGAETREGEDNRRKAVQC